MNKKTTLSRLGAGTLAVATVVAGLSFGPAAANAATTSAVNARLAQSGSLTLAPGQTGTLTAWMENPNQAGINGVQTYAFDAPTGTHFANGTINERAREGSSGHWWTNDRTCDLVNDAKRILCVDTPLILKGWSFASGQLGATTIAATVVGDTTMPARGVVSDGLVTFGDGTVIASGRTVGLSYTADTPAFTVTERSHNLVSRTATLEGTGTAGATVIINDTIPTEVGADGKWSYTVNGLTFGKNTVKVEQWQGTVKTATESIDLNLDPTAVSASATFLPTNESNVEIVGAAYRGADIEIYLGDKMVRTVEANDITGRFSADVAAPNAGGVQTYTVKQRLGGELAPITAEVKVDFGAAVSITSPAADSDHAGGAVQFQGNGVGGGKIEIRKQGSSDVIGETTVLPNGSWTRTIQDVPGTNAVYVVTQTGKGNNVTQAQVHLNPGVSDNAPLVIDTPAYGATVALDPDGTTFFMGTGEPGATVLMRAGNGRVIFSTLVTPEGKWSARGLMAVGTSNPSVDYTIPGEKTVTVQHRITATPGITQPFSVTNPVSGSTVQNTRNTLTGKGTPQSKVELKTGSGRVILSTTVNNAGNWSATGDFAQGTSNPTFTITDRADKVTTSPYRLTVGNPGVVQPLSIATPAMNSTVESEDGRVTFSGTGTTGAVITFKSGAGSTVAQATVGNDGKWSTTGMVGFRTANLAYSYQVGSAAAQTGTQTFTVKKPGTEQAFEVTSPAIGATVTSTDGTVTFTGKGTTGATVKIGSASSDYFSVKIDNAGNWTGKGYVGYRNAKSLVTYIDENGAEHKSNLDYTVVAP